MAHRAWRLAVIFSSPEGCIGADSEDTAAVGAAHWSDVPTMTPMALAAAAARLASEGLPVFPCAIDKKPVTGHGFKDSVLNPAAARSLFLAAPGAALIGVPTGPASGLAVVDIDPQGRDWFYSQVRAGQLPATRIHRTRRGGFHLLYQCPDPPLRNSAGKLAAGVDTRGEGGYIIHPPSPGYEVIDETPPAPLPKWIMRALDKKPKLAVYEGDQRGGDEMTLARFVARSRPGERNMRLFWAACRLGEHGLPADEVAAAARATGLDEAEIQATIISGLRRGRDAKQA